MDTEEEERLLCGGPWNGLRTNLKGRTVFIDEYNLKPRRIIPHQYEENERGHLIWMGPYELDREIPVASPS